MVLLPSLSDNLSHSSRGTFAPFLGKVNASDKFPRFLGEVSQNVKVAL